MPTSRPLITITYRKVTRKFAKDYLALDNKTLLNMYSRAQSQLNNLLAQLNDERTTQEEAHDTISTIMWVRQDRAEIYSALQNKK